MAINIPVFLFYSLFIIFFRFSCASFFVSKIKHCYYLKKPSPYKCLTVSFILLERMQSANNLFQLFVLGETYYFVESVLAGFT